MELNRSSVALLVAIALGSGALGAFLVTRGIPGEQASFAVQPAPQAEAPPPQPVESQAPVAQAPMPPVERRPQPKPVVRAGPGHHAAPSAATVPTTGLQSEPRQLPGSPAAPADPTSTDTISTDPARSDPRVTSADHEPVPAAPTGPVLEELVVAADSVVGLITETSVSSEQARVEDPVTARVSRDVQVGSRVAIPSGSKVHGQVVLVEKGGRLRERARLGVRFTSVETPDGLRLPIRAASVFREGASPNTESAAKIGGGALGGAIVGAILGGSKGAAIGGSIGAGAGTAAVMAGGRNPATLPSGTPVTVRLEEPLVVTVER